MHAAPSWLPHALLALGPRGLAWWQWLGIAAAVLASIALGRVLGWASRAVLTRLAKRTITPWDASSPWGREHPAARSLFPIGSYPNGKLAEARIESLSARDRLRFSSTVLLARTTTAEQARAVLTGMEAALCAQPKISSEPPSVRLDALGEKGLVLVLNAWFETTDVGELARLREKALLDCLAVVQNAGAALGGP